MTDIKNRDDLDHDASSDEAHRPKGSSTLQDETLIYSNPNKTVVQPKPARMAAQPEKVLPSLEVEAQLTQMREAVRQQDTSRGFAKATQSANKALATNKIILNKRFVLDTMLGAGGMGTVYRAKDLRKVEASDPNPFVAIKVLNDDFKDHPDAFVTLQREASRSHTLSHPNIITVHDFDRDGDVIYMTMELLQGQGLDALIRQSAGMPVPKTQALKIIKEICIALAHAHKKNIIHSDLKPGNVFICKDGVRVLDFGIARLMSQSANADFDAGKLGALTPAYASLEMIQGEPPHPADDVYAASIIAYQLLGGKHPYDRKPADIALRKRLKPKPIKNLSNQQWQTLAKGLRLKREDRMQDIGELFKGLVLKPRSIKKAIAVTVIISAALAAFGYRYFAGNLFLSRIEQTLAHASECMKANEFGCAKDNANAVLQLDQNNLIAKDILTQAEKEIKARSVLELESEFENCLFQKQSISCAESTLESLRKLAQMKPLEEKWLAEIETFKQNKLLESDISRLRQCYDAGDYDCTVKLAETLLSKVDHPEVETLLLKARDALNLQKINFEKRRVEYLKAIRQAQDCLDSKDYACAESAALAAEKFNFNSAEAIALKQRIIFARTEHERNLNKAIKVLEKGKRCLGKKNYSCAIANAESALEFIPGYQPAFLLKNEAEEAVRVLKSQIVIE